MLLVVVALSLRRGRSRPVNFSAAARPCRSRRCGGRRRAPRRDVEAGGDELGCQAVEAGAPESSRFGPHGFIGTFMAHSASWSARRSTGSRLLARRRRARCPRERRGAGPGTLGRSGRHSSTRSLRRSCVSPTRTAAIVGLRVNVDDPRPLPRRLVLFSANAGRAEEGRCGRQRQLDGPAERRGADPRHVGGPQLVHRRRPQARQGLLQGLRFLLRRRPRDPDGT